MSDQEKSNVLPIAAGVLVAVAIAVAVLTTWPDPEPVTEVVPVALTSVAPVLQDTVMAPSTQSPEETASLSEPVAPNSPQFDTFRVETDGQMVIAGRADPGQIVDIILAGIAIERVMADASGSFVAFPVASPSDVPRRLRLLADPEGLQIRSETSYLVAPIAAPVVVADVPAQAQTPAAPSLPTPDDVVADAAPVTAVAPTVLEADAQGVRVVQASPTLTLPNVALDAITYDPDGEVRLAGRATQDGAVQVYIDNKPVTDSPVKAGGDWQIDLPSIDTGVYILRIDEVDAQGDVVSRIETPFKREDAADVAAVLAEETARDGFEVAVKTVQPGATLWAIAEESLGSGIYYVEVFEANIDLIRDPDLIYPGQIFRMPEITQ